MKHIVLNRKYMKELNNDIKVYQFGTQKCNPGHFSGPCVRDHFIIHYIHNGKGIFSMNNTTYYLEKGQGFVIPPNTLCYYEADLTEPWNYTWIGFQGTKAKLYLEYANISVDKPVFTYLNDNYLDICLNEITSIKKEYSRSMEFRALSILYNVFSHLIQNADTNLNTFKVRQQKELHNHTELYIKKAIEFIEMNYSSNIKITDISDYIGLESNYLATIFKKHINISPQTFLINYRIEKACELLQNRTLSISDIARSVGYSDPLAFSKIFRKYKNCSPQQFRKTI